MGDVVARNRLLESLLEVSLPRPRLGRYVVLGTLGRGGMGTVLEAFDRTLDRRVALKILHSDLGDRYRRRLMREAQALAKLSHPNVVQIYEAGEADGRTFIAMELVQGTTLRAWQRERTRSWREHVQIYLQAGEGLAAAHARGLVHRDFKPSNAIIDDDGRARVLDFGLAQGANEVEPSRTELGPDDAALDAPLTRTGVVLGTPAYMSPEQMDGEEVDARSDQFSFCVSLYEALYGQRPFDGRSLSALAQSIREGRVRPVPKRIPVPSAIRLALLRGLEADPARRWPTMDDLLARLRRQVTPRTRRWLALGLASGLTAIGIGIGRYAEVGLRCRGAEARLAGIWDGTRKREVKEALLGTGLSYAPDTWRQVEQRLDDYARAWTTRHTAICEATRVTQEQTEDVMSLRMGCLSSRRIDLRAAVDVLTVPDEGRARRAVQLAASLPELSRCDDVEVLRAELPPPQDPDIAATVELLREDLAQARALRNAGEFASSKTTASDVVDQAETLGYGPLLAEALVRRGDARDNLGEHAEARRDLERAFLTALRHEHEDVLLQAARKLTWVVGYRLVEQEPGRHWERVTLALSKRPRTTPRARAAALGDVGNMLHKQGQLAEAAEQFRSALAHAEEGFGPEHPAVALALHNLGNVLDHQGQYDEAEQHLRRSLAIKERVLGPHHPDLAISINALGILLKTRGKPEDALPLYRRALRLWEAALGPEHPDVARALTNIGNVHDIQGRLDDALVHHRRALRIHEKAYGLEHPDVAGSLDSIGSVLASQGKLDEALAHLQRSLAIRERTLPADHPDLGISLSNIGNVQIQRGKPDQALEYLNRALVIWEKTLGPRHFRVGYAVNNIGHLLHTQGRLEEAREQLERALAILEDALNADHPALSHPLTSLARIALEQGEPENARAHAERAASIVESKGVAPADRAFTRFVLARTLWADPSQRLRARSLAEQSRATTEEHDDPHQALAEIDAWLAAHP